MTPDPVPAWARDLDCQACGACCREGYDTVEVDDDEPFVALHPELLSRGPFGHLNLKRQGSRCACLGVTAAGWTCSHYAVRPQTCRDVEIGSEACRFARQRVGLPVG
jgi:Fe-S-cluster containining protein